MLKKNDYFKIVSFINLMFIDFLVLLCSCFIGFSILNISIKPKEIQLVYTILFTAYFIRELYFLNGYLLWEEIRKVLGGSFVAFFLLIFFGYFIGHGIDPLPYILVFPIFFILDIVSRYLYRVISFKIGFFRINTLIIGTGFQGQILEEILQDNPFSGYKIFGRIIGFRENASDLEIMGYIKDTEKLLDENNIDEVVIAVPQINRKDLSNIITKLEGRVKRIKFIPDMYALMTFSTKIEDFEKVLTITASQGLLNPFKRIYKRIFDLILGSVGIMLLIPIYIFSFIAIKLEDGGNVIFTQDRVGKNGEKIKIYKFRTMVPNAENVLKELMEKDPAIKEEYEKNKKLEKDPRITKTGKFLRKTSFDEFPQFINVIKGEMSIVGPRPYLFGEIKDMRDKYSSIIKTKPGITGLWQASGRHEVPFDERIILDQYYVRNWSIRFDILIIVKTIKEIFKGA